MNNGRINEKLNCLISDFKNCKDFLIAIGDETRQTIITALMSEECLDGARVGEITKKTHLSRPAVSHHLKILKDAGIIQVRKEATMNYYYLDVENKLSMIKGLIANIESCLDDQKKNKANKDGAR